MVTWPVLPGVGIGAQAWPNLAFGRLGSSSTKPFKLYLHWGNTQMIWKSINFFSYWGKKIRQELWAIVRHHISTTVAAIYINSLKLATDILLLLLLVYYCYYLLQSLVECSLQGQPISERTHTPMPPYVLTWWQNYAGVLQSGQNCLHQESHRSGIHCEPGQKIHHLKEEQWKKNDDNLTWNNLCCEFWRFAFLTKRLFCFIAERSNSGVIPATKQNDGVVTPLLRFCGCPSGVVITRPDI